MQMSIKPDIEIIIRKRTKNNRKILLKLKEDKRLANDTSIIYLYSLVEHNINYPNKDGKVIYIGEACRMNSGERFCQHISCKKCKGGDTGSNYTISNYYRNNYKIKLKIYILPKCKNSSPRKNIEMQLLRAHVKEFGSLPIAQGASGKNYTISSIHSYIPMVEIEQVLNA